MHTHTHTHRVANHMGKQASGDWNNFSKFVPFNDSQYYHPYCVITDFTNQHMVSPVPAYSNHFLPDDRRSLIPAEHP